MKTQARIRNLDISAQKLRLQTAGFTGGSVTSALTQLSVRPHKGAAMVFDAIKSAVANAEHNNNLQKSNLMIAEIRVDQGAKLKRWRPRSRGMAAPIIHPKAHLTVVLSEQPKSVKATTDKAAVKPTTTKTKKEEKK